MKRDNSKVALQNEAGFNHIWKCLYHAELLRITVVKLENIHGFNFSAKIFVLQSG
jgi:hypothetical protein